MNIVHSCIEASNSGNHDALVALFLPDAQVHDEEKTIHGAEEIEA